MSHPNCNAFNCKDNCCNYYGHCPENYSEDRFDKTYTQCFYYYGFDLTGVIVGVIVGVVVLALT